MSLKTNKENRVLMHVVVKTMNEEDVQSVQKELLAFDPQLSFSPYREQSSLENAVEFMATGPVDEAQKEKMIAQLNNDWDEEDGTRWAYGFNTRMFSPLVYYLQIEFTR